MQVIEQQAVTLRGQESVLVVSDGLNGDGETCRQAVVAFSGKDGQALLSISGRLDEWDPDMIAALVASIR